MNSRGGIYIVIFSLIGILLGIFIKTFFEEDSKIRILSTTVNENCSAQLKESDFNSRLYELCEGKSACSYNINIEDILAKCKPLIKVEWLCSDKGFIRVIYSSTENKNPNGENSEIDLRCPGRRFKPSHSIVGI